MSVLDAYAHTCADLEALAPVWWAMRGDERGTFYAGRGAIQSARREGMWRLAEGPPPRDRPEVLLVARSSPAWVTGRRLVVLEGVHPAHERPEAAGHLVLTGGPERPGTIGVGVPRLDWWSWGGWPRQTGRPAVAVVLTAPEAGHVQAERLHDGYADALPALAIVARNRGWHLMVLAPRIRRGALPAGVIQVDRFDLVLRQADVCASDHEDRLVEFARLAGPAVPLTAPWHTLAHVAGIGPVAEHPGRLTRAIGMALGEQHRDLVMRRRTAFRAYPLADGRAAARAADAIRRHVL